MTVNFSPNFINNIENIQGPISSQKQQKEQQHKLKYKNIPMPAR